ncbi:hypothetical protein ACNI65_14045 [Roseateles sp. So40a]|uniref:hypothetical protein n=1 Tax=Roseateles sp. So40a TaxID=3400226 RepID=UPI003A858ADE
MIRLLFAAVPLLALAACASDGATATTQTADANGQKVTCEREARTGSMLGKRECGPAMSDDDRRRISNEVGNMVKPRGTTAPGS